MLSPEEFAGAENALKWAARTYVVAAIGVLASLLYWALQVLEAEDKNKIRYESSGFFYDLAVADSPIG